MTRTIHLKSISRAEDAAYRAMADLAATAPEGDTWRLVGGHMVNIHAALAGIDRPPRATMDADVGLELLTIRSGALIDRLRGLGYANPVSSNRFEHPLDAGGTAAIDILAPSSGRKLDPNVDAGPINVDGIPGLHIALARPGLTVTVHATLSDSRLITPQVQVPDLASAIALKTFAYRERSAAKDATDLLRLLEAANTTGLTAEQWPRSTTFTETAQHLRTCFGHPGRGLHNAAPDAATRTRMRALVRRLIGA